MMDKRKQFACSAAVIVAIAVCVTTALVKRSPSSAPPSGGAERQNRVIAPHGPARPPKADAWASVPSAIDEQQQVQRPEPQAGPAQDAAPNPAKTAPPVMPEKRSAVALTPDQPIAPVQQIARWALSFVGADADAEDVWIAAINDPSLPSEDRKNLIEDLNEDGFADPAHPSADELPLIVNRLELIESLALDAIDDVNFMAFAEAHKDLLEMYRQLTQ